MVADSEEGGMPLQHFLPHVPAGAPDYETQCRAAVASTFGAVLQLTRDGVVSLAIGSVDSFCIGRRDPA